MSESKEYILGINEPELERLKFQHGVWGEVTNSFLARLKIQLGWKCLDVGAGPGFVAVDIADWVGKSGEVTLLEPANYFLEYFRNWEEVQAKSNFILVEGTVDSAELPLDYYDFIFVRWVVDFVPNQENFMKKLFGCLKKGGIIAIQDYYYEGLSLFPKGGAFDGMADVVRAYYKRGGGNAYVTGIIPQWFRENNIELIDYTGHSMCGGQNHPITEWAHRFFVNHIPKMGETGFITQEKADALLSDWLAHRQNPDMIFFAPNLVDIAGRKK
ncbi:MAG: methyltransferase domain-containing protein [Bacteroidetes bacterium]|nr:methyltransferase domain-containing protein [Bacteroidota bacterium]